MPSRTITEYLEDSDGMILNELEAEASTDDCGLCKAVYNTFAARRRARAPIHVSGDDATGNTLKDTMLADLGSYDVRYSTRGARGHEFDIMVSINHEDRVEYDLFTVRGDIYLPPGTMVSVCRQDF